MRWKRNRLALAGVVVTLAAFAAACSSNSSSSSSAVGGTSTSTSSAAAGGTDVSGTKTFDISAQDFSFSPSELDGTAGQTLQVTVTNEGPSAHTFTIDSEQINVTLQPGQSQEVTVTFPQSGSVEFYCTFHVSSGMKGTLTVA